MDYRGEWMGLYRPYLGVKVHKYNKPGTLKVIHIPGRFPFNMKDRAAQFMIEKNVSTVLSDADDLNETARGEGGHGSTGKK